MTIRPAIAAATNPFAFPMMRPLQVALPVPVRPAKAVRVHMVTAVTANWEQ
jgi:hypothetical protein